MMDLKKLEKVMELMQQYGVSEVEFDEKGLKTRVSFATAKTAIAPTYAPPQPVAVHHQVTAAPAAAPSKEAPKSNYREIRSPVVGTFYESGTPGAEPFVKPGKKINVGDVLCIVEAMKLMNEIEAEVSGTIVEVLAKNGQPVEFNQVLFLIE